jgi:hypothetical protein
MRGRGNLLLFAMVSIFSKLNEQLYKLHLECADKCPNIWHTLLTTIAQKLTLEMESYYDNLNKKLDKPFNKQQ